MYERLDSLLKKHGITAYRLAKEVGMSQSSLSEWKRGNSIPKYDKLVKIAQYFNVSVSYLSGSEAQLPEPGGDAALLEKLTTLLKEKLADPEWSDEQSKLNFALFNSLSEEKQAEALRYLRYLVSLQEAEKL
jgi:transcriptional regulator with XRE-family HTH domain